MRYCDKENRRPADCRRGERSDFRPLPELRGDYRDLCDMGDDFRTMPAHPGDDGGFQTMPARPDESGDFRTMPACPGDDGDFRTMPVRPGGRHPAPHRFGHGFPGGPGFPGRPPHGMPPFGPGGPGFPPHGRPPHRPDPEALSARIEESDLIELMELAGRMLHSRPNADPARGQNLILSILAGREPLSQRELQQMLGIQPGSLSEILTKLERKSLIRREKGEDRRGNRLYLTDAGRQAIAAPASPDDTVFAALTAEEQSQLRALLSRLLLDWAERFDRGPRRSRPDPAGDDGPVNV